MLARIGNVRTCTRRGKFPCLRRKQRDIHGLERIFNVVWHFSCQELRRKDSLGTHRVDGPFPLCIRKHWQIDLDSIRCWPRPLHLRSYHALLDIDVEYLALPRISPPALQTVAQTIAFQHGDPTFSPPGFAKIASRIPAFDTILCRTRYRGLKAPIKLVIWTITVIGSLAAIALSAAVISGITSAADSLVVGAIGAIGTIRAIRFGRIV